MADFGYDVADYCDVHPLFGTLADFERLVDEAHRRGLRVILDFVPNHSSDRHPWFLESRSSRTSPKRDWYLWADPRPDGGPPNNWRSGFGGSAWQLDEPTGQYYYHAFLKEQPDLNWRNPRVREAMDDVLRFWLDRGVDGFRVDVIWQLVKDDQLRDNPLDPACRGQGPRTRRRPCCRPTRPTGPRRLRSSRSCAGSSTSTTTGSSSARSTCRSSGSSPTTASTAGACTCRSTSSSCCCRGTPPAIVDAITSYERLLPPGGWPNWVLGNHDKPRIASRVGAAQARVAAMLLLTLRGTPTIYYGEEIGMTDVDIPPELQVDPARFESIGRDPERTPMQWSAEPGAGFTTGRPWLPLGPDAARVNVAAERDDPRSILALHRRLLALRRAEPALAVGDYDSIESEGSVVRFVRVADGRRLTIALESRLGACLGGAVACSESDRPLDPAGSRGRARR